MPTTLTEGKFSFSFKADAIKFDETDFYDGPFQNCPGQKGVDFLAASPKDILFLEIKDCSGEEKNNLWRILPDNKGKKYPPKGFDITNRDSLDIEVVQKVIFSLLCLYGAWTKETALQLGSSKRGSEIAESAQELSRYWRQCVDPAIRSNQHDSKKLRVILFLEGEFGSDSAIRLPEARNRKQILNDLKSSIQNKLRWLNCDVDVVNSTTYKQSRGYTVREANSTDNSD